MAIILWDELYHCFLTPLCSGSEAGHFSGVLQLCILILTKCTWIVKSFTHFFILPLHFFFLVNIVLGYTSLIADLFLVLWFMIYESCRWKVMHSRWSVSDLWFIRLDGTLVDNKQRKSLLRPRLKSHQQFSSHKLKLLKVKCIKTVYRIAKAIMLFSLILWYEVSYLLRNISSVITNS